MKIIKHNLIEELKVSAKESLKWVDEALRIKNESVLPAKISMKPTNDIFYNIMPTIIPAISTSGIKIVRRYPNNIPSLDSEIILYSLDQGNAVALLDGNYITTLRTGSVAAHSIHLLAKKDFKYVTWIGLGNTAKATVKSLLSVYENRDFVFYLMEYKNHAEAFIDFVDSVKGNNTVKFEICKDENSLMENADVIISSVTYQKQDFCDPSIYKPGVLIVPIHTRGFMECDRVFDKVFVDDIEHIRQFMYFDEMKEVREVSEILFDSSKGRTSNDERIIVYNIGLSIHDIFHAKKIYEKINNEELSEVNLNAPKVKHWFK